MEVDWMKFGSLLLGAAGTLLGGYNLLVARHERRQRVKHSFALLLLSLEPILDRILSLPMKSPDDLMTANPILLAEQIAGIDAKVDEVKKDLVLLIPEIAGRILNLRRTSTRLRIKLSDPASMGGNVVPEAAAYLYDAWGLTIFRSYADGHMIQLSDQGPPSPSNWMGDEKVGLLVARWEAFFAAQQALESGRVHDTDA